MNHGKRAWYFFLLVCCLSLMSLQFDGNYVLKIKIIAEKDKTAVGFAKLKILSLDDPRHPPRTVTADAYGVVATDRLREGKYLLKVVGLGNSNDDSTSSISPDLFAVDKIDGTKSGTTTYLEISAGAITLEGEKKTVEHTIVLPPSSSVTGKVTYDDGSPAAGVVVEPLGKWGITTIVDDKGVYRINGLNPVSEPVIDIRTKVLDGVKLDRMTYRRSIKVLPSGTSMDITLKKTDKTRCSVSGQITLDDKAVEFSRKNIVVQHLRLFGENTEYATYIEGDLSFKFNDIPSNDYKFRLLVGILKSDGITLKYYAKEGVLHVKDDATITYHVALTKDDDARNKYPEIRKFLGEEK